LFLIFITLELLHLKKFEDCRIVGFEPEAHQPSAEMIEGSEDCRLKE